MKNKGKSYPVCMPPMALVGYGAFLIIFATDCSQNYPQAGLGMKKGLPSNRLKPIA
jgi:hypothetical protein